METREMPRIVAVETTNRCNAKCVFCPNSTMRRDRQVMGQDLFEKIIDDCTNFPLPAFEPFLNGEPLTDPHIMERLELVRRRLPKTELRLYTNGYALTAQRLDALSEIGVGHLFVSLNTLDPEKYESTMGLSLEKTLENLRRLSAHPKRSSIAELITIRMTRLADTTMEEQQQFIDFCADIGAQPFIVALYNYKGDIPSTLPVPNFPCANITRVDILASGKVTLCCMDQEGEYAWGDIREQSVLEVFNNTAAEKVKRMHRSGKRRKCHPCNVCNYCSPSYDGVGFFRKIRFKREKTRYWSNYKPRGAAAPAPIS